MSSDQVNGQAVPTEAGSLFGPQQTDSEKADQWVPYLQRIQRLQGGTGGARNFDSNFVYSRSLIHAYSSLPTCTINKEPAVGAEQKQKKADEKPAALKQIEGLIEKVEAKTGLHILPAHHGQTHVTKAD